MRVDGPVYSITSCALLFIVSSVNVSPVHYAVCHAATYVVAYIPGQNPSKSIKQSSTALLYETIQILIFAVSEKPASTPHYGSVSNAGGIRRAEAHKGKCASKPR